MYVVKHTTYCSYLLSLLRKKSLIGYQKYLYFDDIRRLVCIYTTMIAAGIIMMSVMIPLTVLLLIGLQTCFQQLMLNTCIQCMHKHLLKKPYKVCRIIK